MKGNHFYISYFGNKRNEVLEIEKHINMTNIKTVIEPYCGSCAMSYYLYTKYPELTYVLNDNNKFLKEMYEIIKDDEKRIEFENKINKLKIELIDDKEKYKIKVKDGTLEGWFIANKLYNIRPGTYPFYPSKCSKKQLDLTQPPIYNFFKNGKIIFTCDDGVKVYNNYKDNENNLILLDPPYLQTEVTYYKNPSTQIYEYLFDNNISNEKAQICLILQDTFITRLLFKNQIKHIYDKKYFNQEKKKVQHIIINNLT